MLTYHFIGMGFHYIVLYLDFIFAGFWIGLNDRDHEGDFRWVGSGQSLSWENWGNVEPNGAQIEDCVVVSQKHGDRWGDNECSKTWYYVCEYLL